MIKKLLLQRRQTGDIAPRHHLSGRKPKILASHCQAMRSHLAKKPDMTLEELRHELKLECSLTAIHYILDELDLTCKKKALHASEQDRPDIGKARKRWRRSQGGLDPARFVFHDESAGKTNMTRLRGRSLQGKRLHGHWRTTTMISSIQPDGPAACMTMEGATGTQAFRSYVREVLCPQRADPFLRHGLGQNAAPSPSSRARAREPPP